MEVVVFILFSISAILCFILLAFILGSCKVSGNCSREEEAYIPKHLDPKDLDDEIKWQDDLLYDDDFIKKGIEDEEK